MKLVPAEDVATATLDILIPTYTRADLLVPNLSHLLERLQAEDAVESCRIVISDNASHDGTAEEVERFVAEHGCGEFIELHSNAENIGLEGNVVRALELAEAPFVMWCGDDDFIAPGYVSFVLKTLAADPAIGCIIPGLSGLAADGTVTPGRIEVFDRLRLPAGMASVHEWSHLAHQMSGLVFRREGLLKHYRRCESFRNPYLFIHFATSTMLDWATIYAPSFKTLVSSDNAKDWSYNSINLLDEVAKNYRALEYRIGSRAADELILRFIAMHSYRLAFRPLKPRQLLAQLCELGRLDGANWPFRLALTRYAIRETAAAILGR